MQMSLKEKENGRWKGWNLEGKTSGKKVYLEIRDWIWGDFFASSYNCVYHNFLIYYCLFWLWDLANGCQDCFFLMTI